MQTDVLILGAGPAGCTTALFLAKAGARCVLADKALFPRDKVCGDALSGKVVEVMKKLDPSLHGEMNSRTDFLPSWGVVFSSPGGGVLRVPFGKRADANVPAPGFIARRVHFDQYLFDKARASNTVTVLEGEEFRSFEKNNSGYLATSRNGRSVQARFIVAADGAYSAFARQEAGIETHPAHHCYGLRSYWTGVEGLDAENFIELHFLKTILPGYFWIFPLPGGGANVGIGMRADVMKKRKISLKKVMEETIQHHPVLSSRFRNAVMQGEVKQWSLPLGSRRLKVSGDSYLLTGDAAQLIDPFTGEGIGNAMMSGMLAAQTLRDALEKEDGSSAFLKQYDELLYKRLGPELQLSYRLQQLVNYPWLFNFIVRKAAASPQLTETISAMFEDMNARARLRNPLFWARLLFS